MSFLRKIFRPIKKVFDTFGLGRSLRAIRRWLTPGLPEKEKYKIQRRGSDNFIPVVYGQVKRVAGIVVDENVHGTNDEFLSVLVVFSMGEIESFDQFYFNGVESTDERWKSKFTIQPFLGSDNQSPVNGTGRLNRWSNTHSHYRGIAGALITFESVKDETIWGGLPEITVDIKGKKCFDPRTNTTVWTENPALHLLDYLTSTVYGKGLTNAEINIDSLVAVAEIADIQNTDTVTRRICERIPTGDPEAPFVYQCRDEPVEQIGNKRFTHNGIIDTEQQLFNNIQELAIPFRGFFPDGDGRFTAATEIEAEPVFHFDASNIVSSVSSALPDKNKRFNQVIIRFPNLENDSEMDEVVFPAADSQTFADWLTEDDGVVLTHTIRLEGCGHKAEAIQAARIAALVSRFSESVNFTGSFEAAQLDVGDVFTISEENRGWENRTFRIDEIKYRDDGLVDILADQHDNAFFPWVTLNYEEIIGGINLGDPFNPLPPTNLQLVDDGDLQTTGRIQWTANNAAFVRRYDVEVYSSGELIEQFSKTSTRATLPLYDAGSYEIRVFTVSTVDERRSAAASLSFDLLEPVAPTDLGVTVGNFEITLEPSIGAALGLGTVFEFDIDPINDPSFVPTYRARGRTATFNGLTPNKQYTVYARTVNPLGISEGVSETVQTTKTTEQIEPIIPETDFGITVKSDIAALAGLTGSVDELLERIAQDINEELAIVETNAEIRRVRVDNINKVVELVNEYLEELEGETLPELAARLVIAEDELENLQVTVIPNINNRLDTAENDLSVLTDSTIPQLQDDLDIAEGTIAAIQGEIFSVSGSVPLTIDDVLETVCQDVAEIYQEIYADRIGANSVTALSIKAGSILADKIAANAITADKIAANAVTADKITADAINGKTINGLTINGAVINAGTLNAIDIVGTSKITGATIEGMTINSGEINAVDITAGTITGAEINGGDITGTNIQGAFMGATEITGGTINATDIIAGTIDGTDIFGVTIEGATIRATSTSEISIFGPTISGGQISGTTVIGTDIFGGKIFIGGSDDEFSPFRVDKNGNMVATSATIEGEVVSVSGNIGGWEIDNVSLSRSVSGVKLAELNAQTPQLTFRNTSGNVTAQLTPSAFRAGLETSDNYIVWTQAGGLKLSGELEGATGTFSGNLDAAGGTFEGDISAATGTFTGQVRGGSIAIGGANAATAPFRVDSAGNMVANSGTFNDANVNTPIINGGQLNLESSGKSIALRTDEDFVLWFGDTSIAPNNRSKSNGDFWIAADGSYRSNIRRRSSVGNSELQSTNYTQRSISLPSVKGTADVTATLTGLLGADFSSTTISNLSIQIELRRGTTVLVTETIPIPTTGTGFNQSFQLAGTFFNATISDNNTSKNYNDTTAYNIRARLQGNGLSNSTTASVRMEIIGLEISDV